MKNTPNYLQAIKNTLDQDIDLFTKRNKLEIVQVLEEYRKLVDILIIEASKGIAEA